MDRAVSFLARAITDYCGKTGVRVLDFGCGAGNGVQTLLDMGFDAYGADIDGEYTLERVVAENRIGTIEESPYRIPFPDDHFDAVVSNTVLEHAVNKEECLREIRRVLKPGGWSMHVLPSKYYLPTEPHIKVPLVNILWPRVPRWYLAVWAFLGVRVPEHGDRDWRGVLDWNAGYVKRGIHYWPPRRLASVSRAVFGNYSAPSVYFARHSHGAAARIARRLPLVGPWLLGTFRMAFIVSRK